MMAQPRVYSQEEIDARLHYVRLDTPSNADVAAAAAQPEWWPCFVFENMLELENISKQLNICREHADRRAISLLYLPKMPASVSCKVALLLGKHPPMRCIFDVAPQGSLTAEPFLDKVYAFNLKYAHHAEYMQAIEAIVDVLEGASTIRAHENPPVSAPASSVANNGVDEASQGDGKPAAESNSQMMVKASAVQETVAVVAEAPFQKRAGVHVEAIRVTQEAKRQKQDTDLKESDEASPNDPPLESDEKDIAKWDAELSAGEAVKTNTPTEQECEVDETNECSMESQIPLTRTSRSHEEVTPPSNNRKTKTASAASSSAARRRASAKSKKKFENVKKPEATSVKRKEAPAAKPESSSKKKKMELELEILTFADVQEALERGGYEFTSNRYCRPCNGAVFASANELRQDLCAYGVNCRCGSSDEEEACECWDEDDKWHIKLWVRYEVIRGNLQSGKVDEIAEAAARKLLNDLGFSFLKSTLLDGYAFPGLKTPQEGRLGFSFFEKLNELWRFLSRFGLPQNCAFEKLSTDDRLNLEFFLSTSRHRVDTFTLLQPDTYALAGELYEPSIEGVSGARARSSPHASDEAATVVSVSSGLSASTSRPVLAAKPKAQRKSQFGKNSSKMKAVPLTARLAFEASKENEGDALIGLPSRRSARARTSPSEEERRVSISPLSTREEFPLPEFTGTDHEKLLACLDALKPANHADRPTFANDNTSKFASNINAVSGFLCAVVESNGQHGGEVDGSTALYVCGAPGLGKTSGVKWCCEKAAASRKPDAPETKICHINAAFLASKTNPLKCVLNELAKCVGLKGGKHTSTTVKKALQRKKEKPNKCLVIVVVDEIDALVSGKNKSSANENTLRAVLEWANDPDMQMALIGISNCMNDENTGRILGVGSFKETVTFASYSECEIQQILEARVGRSVVAPNVLDYIAKKVASSTGDARKALEMAANAVQHRLEQTKETESAIGHLVKMPNVVLANKDETVNLKDRIAGQPIVGKVILCVLTSFAQAGVLESTVGELKLCVSDCMQLCGSEDEMLQMDDFLVLLETLVDSGLLRASPDGQPGDEFCLSGRILSDVHHQPIFLGTQLDEIERALESDLKQAFYQTIRDSAKNRRKGRN